MARFIDKTGVIATRGFFNEVPNPAYPGSRSQALAYGVIYAAIVPIGYAVASSTFILPANAAIVEATVVVSTAFNGTSPTVKVGSAAGLADQIPATAIAATGATFVGTTPPFASVITPTQYVTVSGSSTAGTGTLIIRYVLNINQSEYSSDFPL